MGRPVADCTLPCVGWDEYNDLRDASAGLTKGREHGGTKQDAPRSATYDALCSTATDRGAELEVAGAQGIRLAAVRGV